MRAVIIDDEAASREALLHILNQNFGQSVQILEVCESPKKGIEAIKLLKPDVVFLDVEMPQMTGFQLLTHLGFPNIDFKVIFSTAHDHYAVQAFRFSAIDFLLKPVKLEHMTEAVLRVKESILKQQHALEIEKYESLLKNMSQSLVKKSPRTIVLNTAEGTIFVNSDDILRLEADGNYTTFYFLNQKSIFITKKIGDFDEKEPFLRVHRSHSVNPKHVVKMNKGDNFSLTMRDGAVVEVARSKREEVTVTLKEFFE